MPKLLAMGGTLVFMGGRLLERLTSFGREMLGAIGQIQPTWISSPSRSSRC